MCQAFLKILENSFLEKNIDWNKYKNILRYGINPGVPQYLRATGSRTSMDAKSADAQVPYIKWYIQLALQIRSFHICGFNNQSWNWLNLQVKNPNRQYQRQQLCGISLTLSKTTWFRLFCLLTESRGYCPTEVPFQFRDKILFKKSKGSNIF